MIGPYSPSLQLLPNPSLKRQINSSQTCQQFISLITPKKKLPTLSLLQNPKPFLSQSLSQFLHKDIEQCPTYRLTYSDMMSDPLTLFKRLQLEYQQFGAIKLAACDQWSPPYSFKYVDKKLTTRVQVISELRNGKAFQQKIESYSVKEFENMALNFENNPGSLVQINQQEFWAMVNNPQYDKSKLKVEYAADLPVFKYGSGFPLTKHTNVPGAQMEYHQNLFNLNNVYKSKHSLLRIIKNKSERISGVTSPWMYIGMMFSSFCWHIEDLYINSLNYNHQGATKTWYIVPRSDKEKFDQYAKMKFGKAFQVKPDMMHRITWMLDPLQLIQHGVKVRKINQQERCYVLTFSKAYHAGYSNGFNVGEAVNFVTTLVLDDIKQADEDYRRLNGKKTAIFPYQWLVFENCRQEFLERLQEEERQVVSYKFIQLMKQRDTLVFVQIQNIKKIIKDLSIQFYSYIQNKQLKYDKNICSGCKTYCYMSFIQCGKCNKKYCVDERPGCCEGKEQINSGEWKLIIREPEGPRKQLLVLLKQIGVVEVVNLE